SQCEVSQLIIAARRRETGRKSQNRLVQRSELLARPLLRRLESGPLKKDALSRLRRRTRLKELLPLQVREERRTVLVQDNRAEGVSELLLHFLAQLHDLGGRKRSRHTHGHDRAPPRIHQQLITALCVPPQPPRRRDLDDDLRNSQEIGPVSGRESIEHNEVIRSPDEPR